MAHQVLLVDDDTSTRYVYRTILARMGLEVAEASDGAQAVEYLSHHAPDLVILDLLLPRKSGVEVLEYIYDCSHLIHTHVIIFSAHDRALFATCAATTYSCKNRPARRTSATRFCASLSQPSSLNR